MAEIEKTTDTINEVDTYEDVDFDINSCVYELGYHIIPAVSEEEAPKEATALKEFIQRNGGKVISEDAPRNMTLAYPMYRTENGKKEKFETAHFGGIKFEMDPTNVIKVKNVLDGNKNILRHIIFKTVKENTRAEIRFPQVRVERKQEMVRKTPLRKVEQSVPVSEEALDKSIKEIVIE